MKAKNLKEFKALKKRYESITLEEIKEEAIYYTNSGVANKLTGFGNEETCSLCENIEVGFSFDCGGCVYTASTGEYCSSGTNGKTFDRIEKAYTPTTLLNAFRARAKHMKTLLK